MYESGAIRKWRANIQEIYRVLAYRNLLVAPLKQDKYIVQHQIYIRKNQVHCQMDNVVAQGK